MSYNEVTNGNENDGEEQYHTATEDDNDEFEPNNDEDHEDEEEEDEDDDDDDDEVEDDNNDEEDESDSADQPGRFIIELGGRMLPLTLMQLRAIVNGQNLSSLGSLGQRRRGTPPDPNRFPKVPSEKGTELMNSGLFGFTPSSPPASAYHSPQAQLAMKLLERELGIADPLARRLEQGIIAQTMIPSNAADMIIRYPAPVYSGQFSDDGNFFYSVGKDFKVRMYDTSSPYSWRYYKTANFPFGQWTLSDASLSPDNRWLAITSLLPHVCLAPTDPNDTGDPYILDLSDSGLTGREQGRYWRDSRHFAIFSVRYSGDSRELVAGTNKSSVIVYDIESRTVLHNIEGHEDDVNAVCFADKASPHILYSGSDDTTIKVWDRRSMGDGRAAGAFVGHVQGLTYIDSKNDGRYLLSNGKDQSMKLWDLRMVMSSADFDTKNPLQETRYRQNDYRVSPLPDNEWFQHPHDNSVVTFRGHRVARTLIRCHFSPPGSTNSRYVYSGSFDGKVYIWNLDATLAATVDAGGECQRLLYPGHDRPTIGSRYSAYNRTSACIREAHWHPHTPMIVASAWGGDENYSGFCSVHSFNEGDDYEDSHMGRLVNEKLGPGEQSLYQEPSDDEEDEDWFP